MTELAVADAGIRRLHACYTDAVWRKDYAAFANCFAEDAEWRITGRIMRGRAEITDFIKFALGRFQHVLITMRTPILDVGDGIASGRTYFTEQSVFQDGRPHAPIGVYYEHFVDQGDQWRFSWRLFHTLYSGPADFSGQFFDNPDYGPPPAMPPRDAVPQDHSGFTRK